MKTRNLLALIAILITASCSDSPVQPSDNTHISATHSAFVEIENNRPALYIQGPNDNTARRIHFTGDAEDLPNSSPFVPKLTDANILALRSPRWSPDGTKLAFVATTAFDQAELVVVDADGSHPRILSVNTQYVMGDVDWSPDGKSIAYAMSTRSNAQGLELFVTNIAQKTVTQVTQGSTYSGLGGVVRFDATASNIYFAKVTGSETGPPYNWITDVRRVNVGNGTISNIATGVVGHVQAIERSGAGILLMRMTSWTTDGRPPRELARISLTGEAPRVLAAGTSLQIAHFADSESYAVLLTETKVDGKPYAYQVLPTMGGEPVVLQGVTDASGGMDARVVKR